MYILPHEKSGRMKNYYANTNQKRVQVVVLFPCPTNYHKLGGLKQPKYIILRLLEVRSIQSGHWYKVREQGDVHLLHLNPEPEVSKAVEFYILTTYAAMQENFLIRVDLYIIWDFLRTQLCSLLVVQYYSYPPQSFSPCFVSLTWLVPRGPW